MSYNHHLTASPTQYIKLIIESLLKYLTKFRHDGIISTIRNFWGSSIPKSSESSNLHRAYANSNHYDCPQYSPEAITPIAFSPYLCILSLTSSLCGILYLAKFSIIESTLERVGSFFTIIPIRSTKRK